jgi:hypothetical protein
VKTVSAGPRNRALDRAGTAGLDELSAERADDGVRHGGEPERPIADEGSGRGADQRIAAKALVEPARVVVEREHEAGRGERLLVGRADDDSPVGALPCRRDPVRRQRSAPGPVARHEPEAIGGRSA